TVLSRLALVVFVGTGAALVWQRPEAGLGLLVAAVAILAWLTLGLFGRRAGRGPLRPLDVLTADADSPRPLRTFGVAAAAAVGLAVTMQAPIVALGPVLVLLFAFSLSMVLERRWGPAARPRAAGVLYALLALALLTGLWFAGGVGVPVLVATAALLLVLALWSGRGRGGAPPRLVTAHGALLELGRSTLSGVGWVGVLAVLGVLTFLGFQEIPPFARFALVFMLFLLAVRAGLACRRVLDEGGSPFGALALLTIPAGVLLVFMLFDFGLGLVFFLPMMTTVLLATRIDRLPVPLAAGSAVLLLVVLLAAASVLRPSRTDLRSATDVAGFSDAFANLGNGFVDGLRATGLTVPVTRATVRGLAATDPALVEEALAWAGPSEALFAAAPSLEQVWGGRAYASAGWTGSGLAGTTSLGRGVPIVVSYAENAFSVYVLSEHGALGGLSVLFAYLALLLVVARWLWSVRAGVADTPEGLAVLALTVGSVLWLALPAAYVGASNLGLVPLTGQNMPFLGLNSWADVMLVSGIGTGAFIVLAGLGPTLAPPAGGEVRP
ncbi:MAG: hypothetical protein KC645_09645, partial [Gemmatimonadetes bacterium]|nr:hypothetical protein [Gemmatimonadota bacterium]